MWNGAGELKLGALQREIEDIYRLDPNPSVEQFIVTSKEIKSYLPDANTSTPQVLLKQENDVVSFAVHVGDQALERIEKDGLENASFADFCSAAEEVSHFTYLSWSVHNDRPVSLLDVEVQGEIDKFLLSHRYFSEELNIFEALFQRVLFHPQADPTVLERYVEANRLAGKLCQSLGSLDESLVWLREFYRLTPQARRKAIQKHLANAHLL
jgi:hypothetical protein